MSERSYVGKIVPLAIYPRGSGAAVSGLLMLGALLALLVAAWVAAFQVGTTALDRADARLASEARSAAAGFSALVAAGDARAGTLAATPALQRAVLRRNAVGVRAEVDGASDVAVYGRGRLLAGRPPSGAAATRTVRVVAGGKVVGRVVATIPVTGLLVDRLARQAGVEPPDRLWLRVGSDALGAPLGKSFDRAQSGRKYRVFGTKLVDGPLAVVDRKSTRLN